MKRKRVRKEKSITGGKKPLQQEFLNYVDKVTEENSESDERNDSSEESESELESYTSPCSSLEGSDEDSDSDDEVDRMMEKVVNAYGKAKSRTKSLSKKVEKVKVNKKAKGLIDGYGNAKLTELDYLSRKQKKSKNHHHHQEAQYCKKELKVALEVIKKVMKMDEAKPFNVPEDPIASGKPDYCDAIYTPMDFSTICSNLQRDVKYMNARDVFKDVQVIWENCYTYNEMGDYVLILMKRVKKKFMKYWRAAGLYSEPERKTKEKSHIPPPTDLAMKCSRHESRCQLGSTIGSTSQMQLDISGPSQLQLQLQFPASCCSQPYQSQQPQPRTAQPQSSQFHADCGSASYTTYMLTIYVPDLLSV